MKSLVVTSEAVETVLRVYVRAKGKVWEKRIGWDAPRDVLREARREQDAVVAEWEQKLTAERGGAL